MSQFTESPAVPATCGRSDFRRWVETTASLLTWCTIGGALYVVPVVFLSWAVR